jgi:hypothetical protein
MMVHPNWNTRFWIESPWVLSEARRRAEQGHGEVRFDADEGPALWDPTGPVRLQLRRVKGFDLQSVSQALNGREAVSVARPHRWGNPFAVGDFCLSADPPGAVTATFIETRADAVAAFARMLALASREYNTDAEIRARLAGKNLACFCPLDEPCHADVLLRVARGDSPMAPATVNDALEIVSEYNRGELDE